MDKPAAGAIVLGDANNFTSMTELTPVSLPTAPGDIQVCWQDVVMDLQCHAVTQPADVVAVELLHFAALDPQVVVDRIEVRDRPTPDANYRYYPTAGETCAMLSSFVQSGEPGAPAGSTVYAENAGAFMVTVQKETAAGRGVHTFAFVTPSAGGAGTVNIPAGCNDVNFPDGLLDYTANLSSLTQVQVPKAGPWQVDWSQLGRAGDGGTVPFSSIDKLLLGFYPNKTPQNLEQTIFDIELDPTASTWEIAIDGTRKADLATAVDANGGPFPGFDRAEAGTWLLGLLCTDCANPAPILLTILNPV